MSTEAVETFARIGRVRIKLAPDDVAYYGTVPLDPERELSYDRGEWEWIGVMVSAELRIPYGKDWITTTIETPGLWGVESDADHAYVVSIANEETDTLRDMLTALRFPSDDIESALARLEI